MPEKKPPGTRKKGVIAAAHKPRYSWTKPTHTSVPTAVVVLHEIYGINQHIRGVCEKRHNQGYDVYAPDLLGRETPFSYAQQEEAYGYFMGQVGFAASNRVGALLEGLRPRYARIVLEGYSVGATLAWVCAAHGWCDGMVGYYGSRIRDYLTLVPSCPALLFFARQEAGFPAQAAAMAFTHMPVVEARILDGDHGFCDPFSGRFHAGSARAAEDMAVRFLQG